MRSQTFGWTVLSLFLVTSAGCANRAVTEQKIDDYDGSMSQNTSFSQESELEKAGRLLSTRDFGGAIEIYQRLYRSSPDQAVRAESLLRWAQAEGNLLNPDRDIDRAIARLELLVGEFPDAAVHRAALEELDRLRGLRDATPQS